MAATPTYQAASNIRRTLGVKCAASYLRNRNVPIETALTWLCGVAAYHRWVDSGESEPRR